MGERVVPKPAKQADLYPEATKDAQIEDAIDELKDCESNRLSWQRKEIDARATLGKLLEAKGFTTESGYKRGPYIGWLEAGEPKAKCRKAESGDGDG